MSLKEQISEILAYINSMEEYLKFNGQLFDIYEGELLKFVTDALRAELSTQSFEQARGRIAPINIIRRLVDKLSKIYQSGVTRSVQDGKDADKDLVQWYTEKMELDTYMNVANELFNLCRGTLLQPYLDDTDIKNPVPRVRVVPNNKFLVWSDSEVDPTRPTHVILVYGTKEKLVKSSRSGGETYETITIYHIYTDQEFIILGSDGFIDHEEMTRIENPEGVNKFRKIPFVYINRSKNLLMPKADRDSMQMALLLPILLSDLNYTVKFQAFSILYGIDVSDEGMVMSPNAFWKFKSLEDSDKTPQVNSIKPNADIGPVLELIQAELSFWLNTRGIRPGAIGQLTTETAASGISKMIDEMDTFEDRQRQTQDFGSGERDFWDLILNHMHPVWIIEKVVENRTIFTPSAKVNIKYPRQIPLFQRGDLVEDLEKEVAAGFTTRRRAIEQLNPEMSPDEVDELIAEIDEERTVTVEASEPDEEPFELEGDEEETEDEEVDGG